jgi:hypothetical protein
MRGDELLPYLNSISVVKNITGSVSVTTPNGPVVLVQNGFAYVIASDRAAVSALIQFNSNIKTLLRQRQISLVF